MINDGADWLHMGESGLGTHPETGPGGTRLRQDFLS